MPPKTTVKPLSEGKYQKLSRELSRILTAAARSSNQEKTAGYWNVGARIKQERLSEEAGYHNAVLRELSQSLGVAARTLQLAVTVHEAYDAPPAGPLTWAHYRLIARLSTKKERNFYEKLAEQESWSVRALQNAIRADMFGGGSPDNAKLVRPTGPSYVYRAEKPHLVDGDSLDIDVDLGFQTWTRRRIRLAWVDCPEIVTAQGRAARNFVHSHLARAKTIVLKTEKVDLHGRYIADAFLSHQTTTIEDCYQNGLYLNAALIAAGHASLLR